jgi:hypothetical protein
LEAGTLVGRKRHIRRDVLPVEPSTDKHTSIRLRNCAALVKGILVVATLVLVLVLLLVLGIGRTWSMTR